MADTPLHYMTIIEVAALIESRGLSPVEVTNSMLERIDALDESPEELRHGDVRTRGGLSAEGRKAK